MRRIVVHRPRPARALASAALPVVALAALAGLTSCGSDGGSGDDGGSAATAAAAAPAASGSVTLVTPTEADALLASPPAGLVVLDVRTPEEFAAGHLPGAVNVDFYAASFADDLAALDPDVPYLVYCHSGNRSGKATQAMQQLGFAQVSDLAGGVTAWQAAGFSLTV